jgi:hypothetical protein
MIQQFHLGLYPKESKSVYNKGNFTLMFIASLSIVEELW